MEDRFQGGLGVSVVIPAFNEALGIGEALGALRAAFPLAEIIVVDDGSQDETARIAGEVAQVRVICHRNNRGYGAAIRTGVLASTGEVVAWYDADGQHTPAGLAALVRRYGQGGVDAVIGARDAASHRPASRQLGKGILAMVVRLSAGQPIADINCGLRLFSRRVLARYLHLLPEGFSASITTTLLLVKRNYRFVFEPVTTLPRVGKSTVRQLRDGFRSLHIILRILVLFQAFAVFSTSAALLTTFSVIYGLVLAIQFGQGFPVAAAVGFLTGVILFFMGLLCDQIVALRMERLEPDSHSPPGREH